jgi:hypothetical protein
MNLTPVNEITEKCLEPTGLKKACRALRDRITAQIHRTRAAILGEFRQRLLPYEQLLQLALNEAESLAWQTRYPHLLFPTLAREKAEEVVAWRDRQQSLLHTNRPLTLAA